MPPRWRSTGVARGAGQVLAGIAGRRAAVGIPPQGIAEGRLQMGIEPRCGPDQAGHTAAGRECCAGHDADVRLAAGEAEAGPTRRTPYPAAAPRRPAPRAGFRRVAVTIG